MDGGVQYSVAKQKILLFDEFHMMPHVSCCFHEFHPFSVMIVVVNPHQFCHCE